MEKWNRWRRKEDSGDEYQKEPHSGNGGGERIREIGDKNGMKRKEKKLLKRGRKG